MIGLDSADKNKTIDESKMETFFDGYVFFQLNFSHSEIQKTLYITNPYSYISTSIVGNNEDSIAQIIQSHRLPHYNKF